MTEPGVRRQAGGFDRVIRRPRPKNSAGRDLRSATLTGVCLGAAVLIAAWIGPFAWYPLVAVAVGLAMWEVLTRLREAGYRQPRTFLLVLGQAMLWLSAPFGASGLVSGFAFSVLFLMFYRLFHNGRHNSPENYVRDTAVGIFVLAWIPLFGSFAALISLVDAGKLHGGLYILTFMLCVIASDVGGYCAGVMFGSHPMAPAVSPSKSWEGFAGSITFGVITGIIVVTWLLNGSWMLGVLLGVALVICATLGDLVESQFKRELGIKDMSDMLPGHGGIMDRLDGMLPAAASTWLVLELVAKL
ncbi:phosphatidate cytidylyltransferase [Corynebacterium mayonis]|uniref:phosphatidate cytidylyltransferase n=1 Tax=Corynebacterium mayonis TaxID=3062461 RepID=UPI003140A034